MAAPPELVANAPREDPDAYNDLMARVVEAKDSQELVALVPALLAFTGGKPRHDFAEAWMRQWFRYEGWGTPAPEGLWPVA